MTAFTLEDLERRVADRAASADPSSWTAQLVSAGTDKAAKKLGEEAVETVIAAVKGQPAELIAESADMLYHWLVVLYLARIPLADVLSELDRRTALSGMAEKASRLR